MRTGTLQKMKGLDPKLIPPRGSKQVGLTDGGDPIYELEHVFDADASAENKKPVLDEHGKPRFRHHPTTGESLYPLVRLVPVYRTQRFILEGTKNGLVRLVEDWEQSKEEKARDKLAADKLAFNDELAEIATRQGLSAGELINRLISKARVATSVEAEALATEQIDFPIKRGGGHWVLSTGMKFRGNEAEAMRAEADATLQAEVDARNALEEDFIPPGEGEVDLEVEVVEEEEVT